MLSYAITFSLLVTAVSSQGFPPFPTDLTPCPQVPIVKNFDLHRYLGRWYEIERFFNPFQNGSCGTADYSLFPNGSVSVVNTQIIEGGKFDTAFGIATLAGDPSIGQLNVRFPFSDSFGSAEQRTRPNYNILATDFDNYAVVYTCDFFAPQVKVEFSWILARKPKIPDSFSIALKKWLMDVNVNVQRYIPTRQTNCKRRPL